MEERIIVSGDGEVLGRLGPKDRILRDASLEKLQSTDIWKIESFYKGHIGELRKLMRELSVYEKAFLFSVATYIGYEDCCLKHDNGNELTFDCMVEITGMSRSKMSEVMDSLINKDILYRGRNSQTRQYFINPWLFCKGNRINKVLKTMFRNYKIRVLNNTKWKNVW